MMSARYLCGLSGSQRLGAEVVHDLQVMIDILAFIQVEGASELFDVHHVRHVVVTKAQHGERPARRGVPAPAERHDLDGDLAGARRPR